MYTPKNGTFQKLIKLKYNNKQHRFMALCPGLPGWASTRRNIHPLTLLLITNHPLSASSIYCHMIHSILPVQFTCLTVFLHNLSPNPLWSISCLEPTILYSIHFFTQSLSSFRCQSFGMICQKVDTGSRHSQTWSPTAWLLVGWCILHALVSALHSWTALLMQASEYELFSWTSARHSILNHGNLWKNWLCI